MNRNSRTRTVFLTGAAHGIGRASARLLASRGYTLGLIDRDALALDAIAQDLSACCEVADVRDRDLTLAAMERLSSRLGTPETLVACAGIGSITTIHNLDLAGFREMLEVNVLGVAHAIEALLPAMFARGSGQIVAISSVAGFRGMPWMPGYSASKAALSTYLEALRPALKRRGVSITTVCPGFVRTRLTCDTPFRVPVPMLEPEEAARHVVRAMERGARDYVFPLTARLGMNLLRRMPNWLFDHMMDRAGPRALTIDF